MMRSVAATDEPPGPRPAISLVVVNARVWTGRADRPWADALAVRGEALAAVGSSAEIRKLAGATARVVDAGGALVVPGADDGAYSRHARRSTEHAAAGDAGSQNDPVLVAGGPADFTLLAAGPAGGPGGLTRHGAPDTVPAPRVILIVAGGEVRPAGAPGPP